MTGLVLNGTAGADTLTGGAEDDVFTGGLGADILNGGYGSDTYIYAAGDGADIIQDFGTGAGNTDILSLTNLNPGDVALSASGYNLLVTVKSTGQQITVANHFYTAEYGIELLQFANGVSWTKAQIYNLYVLGATSAEGAPIVGTAASDVLTGTALGEFILAEAGNDAVYGGLGGDSLVGDAGDDALYGEAGNDKLYGGLGVDTLIGGAGADTLQGDGGSDVYVYASGDGADTINEIGSVGDVDVLRLTDLNPGDISLSASGNNLLVTVKATGQQITIANHYYAATHGIEKIEFANGVSWSRAQFELLVTVGGTQVAGAPIVGTSGADALVGTGQAEFVLADAGNDTVAGGAGDDSLLGDAGDDVLSGDAGNDKLYGGVGADLLIGGQGADTLKGDGGADTYQYASGDGSDIIEDLGAAGEVDTLKLTNLEPGDVSLTRSGNHLIVTVKATGEQITVNHHYYSAAYGIEQIQFANGVAWTRPQIELLVTVGGTQVAGAPIVGTAGADTLVGTSQAEFLLADAGNDTVAGGAGDDSLLGDAGDDVLSGEAGNDKLYGGLGVDILIGGQGADTLKGDGGADTYLYASGDGNDVIDDVGVAGEIDTLKLTDLTPGDVTLARSGSHLIVTVKATGEQITVSNHYSAAANGVDRMEFANGVVWSRAQVETLTAVGATLAEGAPMVGTAGADAISGTALSEFILGDAGNDVVSGGDGNDSLFGEAGDDVLVGEAGADNLYGGAGADTLTGGAGADTVRGEAGSDLYLYASGDGADVIEDVGAATDVDVLRLADLAPGDVTLVRTGYNLVVTVKATGEQITVSNHYYASTNGIERIEFAGGTVWTRAQFETLVTLGATLVQGAPILGTTGIDVLTGTGLTEFILGDAGDDTVNAGNGDDQLFGEAGNDVLRGEAGNDTIYGGAGNDSLTGGAGTDILVGEGGSDTYFFASGTGSDTVTELGVDGTDILRLTDLNPGDVTLASSANALVVTVKSTGETITVSQHGAGGGAYGVEQIQFADGTVWTKAQIYELNVLGATFAEGVPVLGTAGDDSLVGTEAAEFLLADLGNDTVVAGGGNDTVFGHAGDDTVFGGAGDDFLYGDSSVEGSGADTLIGGLGADTLNGSGGGDTYVYASGDGNDTIVDRGQGGTDILKLTDLYSGDVTLASGSNGLVITVKATGETITVTDHGAGGGAYGLEQIQFADGAVWTKAQIYSLNVLGATLAEGAPVLGTVGADTLVGTALSEFLLGDAGNDALMGGAGNDSLYGEAGGDVLNGGTGDDVISGGAGDDRFEFDVGFGADRITDFVAGGVDDQLDFSAFATSGVTWTLAQIGANAVFTFSNGDVLTLSGVNAASLVQIDPWTWG
ncbi:S-layer family protein [Caulobacter sp. 17J80-11]|uniref:beta strand repeat-containing protein n=1 Tax=Caulobacter sp. 17J80-11 TaxID=2763502 RepID=UPI001653C0DE|nr:calcium-binding protein [Caulobacter sp. 17J80-11]MBC6980597.1 hypothetical protein [Caulobacter sp. 17J80-11]